MSQTPYNPLIPVPLIVATALIAGAIGALAAFLVMESISAPDTASSLDDAAIVCTKVEGIELPIVYEELQGETYLIYQLFGISTFTTAAALGDNANASLEQPGKDLLRGVQVFNDDLINDSLDQLSTACESIDY